VEHFLDLPRNGTVIGVAGHLASAAAVQRVLDQGADLAYIGKAAIADHAFARRAIADPGYHAPSFPVTRDHLRSEKLGGVVRDVLRDQLASAGGRLTSLDSSVARWEAAAILQ
jgi:hypothetical protein